LFCTQLKANVSNDQTGVTGTTGASLMQQEYCHFDKKLAHNRPRFLFNMPTKTNHLVC